MYKLLPFPNTYIPIPLPYYARLTTPHTVLTRYLIPIILLPQYYIPSTYSPIIVQFVLAISLPGDGFTIRCTYVKYEVSILDPNSSSPPIRTVLARLFRQEIMLIITICEWFSIYKRSKSNSHDNLFNVR